MDDLPNSPHAVPTVSVVGADGNELRINRADYEAAEEGKYQLWGEGSAPAFRNSGEPANKKAGGKKKNANADNTFSVIENDGRFFVADGDGNKIDDDPRFDHENGYATDVDAWTATTQKAD